MRKFSGRLPRGQRGITGLETAIILIAFVVVASVFAFTVLSTGVFSSERSKETIYAGLQEARSSLEPRGSVVAYTANHGSDETIFKVSMIVGNAVAGEPIDLTPPYSADDTGTDPVIISGAQYKTTVSYTDQTQYMPDVPWTIRWVGDSSGDNLLEEGEKAEITVWLLQQDTAEALTSSTATSVWTADPNGAHGILATSGGELLGVNEKFTMEIKPPTGSVVDIQRTLPPKLDTVIDLK